MPPRRSDLVGSMHARPRTAHRVRGLELHPACGDNRAIPRGPGDDVLSIIVQLLRAGVATAAGEWRTRCRKRPVRPQPQQVTAGRGPYRSRRGQHIHQLRGNRGPSYKERPAGQRAECLDNRTM